MKTKITIEKKIDYAKYLSWLLSSMKIYRETGKFISKNDLQVFIDYQDYLKKCIQEQGYYTKQDFENFAKNSKDAFYRETFKKVIQSCDDATIEELLTPLVLNFYSISIDKYLTTQKKPFSEQTQEMIKYAQFLYIIFNELNKYQKQGVFYHDDFKCLQKHQKKLKELVQKQGLYSKQDFLTLKQQFKDLNLKKDFFGNYMIQAVTTIIKEFDSINVEKMITPIAKPLMKRFTTLHHEIGHAIIILFSKYWDLRGIAVYKKGFGFFEFISYTKTKLTSQQKVEQLKENVVFFYGGLAAEEWLQKQYPQIKPQASFAGDLQLLRKTSLQLLYYQENNKFKENIKVKDFNIRSFKQLTTQQKEYIDKLEIEAYQKAVKIIQEKEFLIPIIYDIYVTNNKYFLTKEKLFEELKKRNIEIQ